MPLLYTVSLLLSKLLPISFINPTLNVVKIKPVTFWLDCNVTVNRAYRNPPKQENNIEKNI